MAELSEHQKLEIVEALACFRSPARIAVALGEEYGILIDRRQVGSYDPTRPYYEGGDKWREIFEARRKAYLEEVTAVPIANQGYRLNVLQEQLDKAITSNKPGTVAALLEQAAKEVGGVLTNERNVRVDDARRQRAADMSPEDRRAALAELFRQAIEQQQLEQQTIEGVVTDER